MDFFAQAGKVALGSRLRRLGEMFAADGAEIYRRYQVPIKPNWFPVFRILSQCEESSITKMARDIGFSHPVISLIVKEMTKAGLTVTAKSADDGRLNVVRLTDKGRSLIPQLEIQIHDVEAAVNNLLGEMEVDLWRGIMEMEALLEHKSFRERVAQQRRPKQQSEKTELGDRDEI